MRRTFNSRRLLAGAAWVAAASALSAQSQFERLPRVQIANHPVRTRALATGDINNDGFDDVLLATDSWILPGHAQNRLYLSDGTGNLSDATSNLPTQLTRDYGVALGDVDGDGDLDAVLVTTPGFRVLLNDGLGNFTLHATENIGHQWAACIALADMDGDGDLDALIAGTEQLQLNDGSGNFTPAPTQPPLAPNFGSHGGQVVVGDFDGDGDLDFARSNREYSGQYVYYPESGRTSLFLNNGSGVFTDATTNIPFHTAHYGAIVAGDIDGDGDLDLAVGGHDLIGTYYHPTSTYLRILTNDGSANFSISNSIDDGIDDLNIGDIDGDGDLDLIAACYEFPLGSGLNRVLLNDGSGTFSDGTASHAPPQLSASNSSALGDFDGDGDLDWFLGQRGTFEVCINVRRQLHAPAPPLIGQTYVLDSYLRNGPPSSAYLSAVWLSTAPANVPLGPLGILRIDAASALPFPIATIPQPSGVVSTNWMVPASPGLVGVEFYGQSVMLAFPNELHLSNVIVETIGQ